MSDMAEVEKSLVKSLYDLPTCQRRLRHVRSITLRNLQCRAFHGKDITKLQVYFTLHVDTKQKEFYKSEVISGSLNPSWQSFDISRHEEVIDIQAKLVVVRVWIRNSLKPDSVKLLVDWTIHLTGLQFFSDKLQQDKYKYVPNMLIVGLYDKYFVSPETSLLPEQDTVLMDPGVSVRNSYTINSLSRIHTVLRAIKQMQASVKKVHRSIEDKLITTNENTRKLSTREDLLLRVGQIKEELAWQMNKLQLQRDSLENHRKAKEEKSDSIKVKFHQLEKNRQNLEEKRKLYFQTREKYIKENAQLLIRRKQLIGELTTYIYPLSEARNKNFCICGVQLPNSENFQGQDETMCAVSLGYTCHLVCMMSQILDFPLRYPMQCKGSRSLITDHIHTKLSDKDKTFPLYAKGKEKFQFNYGVFLLNKNISQLRFYCGLGTTDLRLTLLNIKSMLELRLGVKFDNLGGGHSLLEVKEHGSIPSNERDETISSIASGGRNSVPDSAEEALERALRNASKNGQHSVNTSERTNIPISLADLPVKKNDYNHSHLSDEEDLFKPTEDAFFKLKTTAFQDTSCGNSSCGSFSEHTNGMTVSSRNLSLSPSPGSGENNLGVDQSDVDTRSQSSPKSCDYMSVEQEGGLAVNNCDTKDSAKTVIGSIEDCESQSGTSVSCVNEQNGS